MSERAKELCGEVQVIMGTRRVPGSDLRTIVDCALADDPGVTAADVVEIIERAEEEARA